MTVFMAQPLCNTGVRPRSAPSAGVDMRPELLVAWKGDPMAWTSILPTWSGLSSPTKQDGAPYLDEGFREDIACSLVLVHRAAEDVHVCRVSLRVQPLC